MLSFNKWLDYHFDIKEQSAQRNLLVKHKYLKIMLIIMWKRKKVQHFMWNSDPLISITQFSLLWRARNVIKIKI